MTLGFFGFKLALASLKNLWVTILYFLNPQYIVVERRLFMKTNQYVVGCKVCGRDITVGKGVYIKANASSLVTMENGMQLQGGYGFIHKECRKSLCGYHSTRYSVLGSKETKCYANAKMGIEIELNTDNKSVRDYLECSYQIQPQRDSSVLVEYATPTYKSLSCISKMLNGLENINFSDYASCHFTLSNDYSIETNKFLIHYRKSVVNYLQNAIVENYNVSDVFGRGFNQWAKAFSDSYVDFTIHNNRYYWLNLTHNNRIEIRLFKFDGTNATQLLNAFKWFKTFYTKCGEYIAKYGNNRKAVEQIQKWIDRNIHTLKAN